MANVFDVLGRDHTEVKAMLAELEGPPARTAGDVDLPLEERRKLVEQLVIEESKHEAVEEEYFWPAVREHLPDGDHLADVATSQEQDAKQVLDDLRKADPTDAQFESLVTQIIHDGREHIAYEEEHVWPGLREMLDADQQEELGSKIEQGKSMAPTRPHPETPPKPGVLKTAGMGAAMMDKARDAVTGRGKE